MNENENKDEVLSWSALEYEEKERSKDWFWALGIIIITSSIASIIFNNYFFAILLILSGVLLGFFAIKKPDMVTYELNNKGLRIRDRLYPYESIKSFWVQLDTALNANSPKPIIIKPTLFIHSDRAFMPILSIPILEEIAQDIHSIMTTQDVAEVEMKDHPSEKIMEILGF